MHFKPSFDGSQLPSRNAVCLVTEANTLMGKAIMTALLLNRDVSTVIGVVPSKSRVTELEAIFVNFKAKVRFEIADGNSVDSMRSVAVRVRDAQLTPTYIFILAGSGSLDESRSIDEISDAEFATAFTRVTSMVRNAIRAFHPLIKGVSGSVIACITSEWGTRGGFGKALLAVPRHALEGLVKCYSAEYGGKTQIRTIYPKTSNSDVYRQIGNMCREIVVPLW